MVSDPSNSDDEPPVSWGSATSAGSGEATPISPTDRHLGFPSGELEGLVVLPDDIEAMAGAIEADGRPFNGAYVPVVVHDTTVAERSYDAAEWAADLIRTAGGRVLAVATFGEPEGYGHRLNPRQWNHAVAMIERLDGVCARFRLRLAIRETVGDEPVADDGALDPERPIGHLLDTGRFMADGFEPARLLCPEGSVGEGGLVERFRGLLRDRT